MLDLANANLIYTRMWSFIEIYCTNSRFSLPFIEMLLQNPFDSHFVNDSNLKISTKLQKKNVQSFQVLKNNWITRQKLMMIWKISMLICSKISWYTHMNCLNCLIECKFWMVSIIKYDNKHFKVINHWLIKSLLFAFWIWYTHDDAGWHVSLLYSNIRISTWLRARVRHASTQFQRNYRL